MLRNFGNPKCERLWLVNSSCEISTEEDRAMKRYVKVLSGLVIVIALYHLPDAQLAEATRVLEVLVVIHLFREVLSAINS